jgi:hypothetical protein
VTEADSLGHGRQAGIARCRAEAAGVGVSEDVSSCEWPRTGMVLRPRRVASVARAVARVPFGLVSAVGLPLCAAGFRGGRSGLPVTGVSGERRVCGRAFWDRARDKGIWWMPWH